MKSKLLLLFLVAITLLITCAFVPPASHVAAPNRLLIVRSPGFDSETAHEMVSRPPLVQQLYFHMLSLPAADRHQVCPMYIIAEYQLTFFRDRASLLNVNVLQGGCSTVTLRPGDKRATDSTFWSLLQQASDVGKHSQPQVSVGAYPTDHVSAINTGKRPVFPPSVR